MRRAVAITLAGAVAVGLQTTVLPVFVPGRLAPNLLLVLVVYLGMHQFGAWGAAGAFALGYVLDTFSGTLLGVHALAFTVVYLGVHQVARVLWTEGGVPAVLTVFAAAGVYALLVLAIASLVSAAGRAVWGAWGVGLLQAVAAAAVTPPVFRLVTWEQRLLGVG